MRSIILRSLEESFAAGNRSAAEDSLFSFCRSIPSLFAGHNRRLHLQS
jgi:hypothetical protein